MDADLNILSVHTLLPPNRYEAPEVEAAFMGWLAGQDDGLRTKARRIFRNAGVEARHSFLDIEEVFARRSLTESTRRYREQAVELGTRALEAALDAAGVDPSDLDILITTSCTGYMIPSVDAYMADRLRMRSDLIRLPVTEMGCAAGASALIYAGEMLRARPGAVAAAVNIEFPTNTMQLDDFSMDNIVGSALFSDGVACTVLRAGGEPGVARIDDWAMHQVSNSAEILGYRLTDTGYLMNLDPTLPEVIAENFERATETLLGRRGLALADIAHFVVHPGGVKILDRVEEIVRAHGGDLRHSRDVMRQLGNMSSGTVIFILQRLLESTPAPGPALLMSFGPGFGAHELLLTIDGGGPA
jgi:predicted naringenin-chalcone synthase